MVCRPPPHYHHHHHHDNHENRSIYILNIAYICILLLCMSFKMPFLGGNMLQIDLYFRHLTHTHEDKQIKAVLRSQTTKELP